MATLGEPQTQHKLLKLMETLTWSLLPCLLLPHQRLARTPLWQRNMSMI
uniref:Uncharacterized protein n=1 Tax=Spermophilus dauricus TaxID=99837 RepID=A0A8C9PAR1_SPEDA